ncbi:MAG TPA: DUF192 domain-containing protein [Actinomycetota bacterium]
MAPMRRILAFALVLAALPGCGGDGEASATTTRAPRPSSQLTINASGGPVTLFVLVADTPEERARGLMGIESMPADQAMAFLFGRPTDELFWMKDTLIPLSVAFWDERDRIVAMVDMEPCRKEPCPTYDAGVPYVGAVEANRGFFASHGITVGDRVELVTKADA